MATKELDRGWERLRTAGGDLSSHFPVSPWQLPGSVEVDADGLWLVWTPGDGSRWAEATPGLLEEFAALGGSYTTIPEHGEDPEASFLGASDAAIAAFARKWGPLGLCQHGLPATHSDRCRVRRWEEDQDVFCEELSRWRDLSGRVRAVLSLADAQFAESHEYAIHWSLALAGYPHRLWRGRPIAERRKVLVGVANGMVDAGRVTPALLWHHDGPTFVLEVRGLWGALGVQLLLSLAGTDAGLTLCDGCSRFYRPSRKPRSDQRHYCPECRGGGTHWRDSKRRRRAASTDLAGAGS